MMMLLLAVLLTNNLRHILNSDTDPDASDSYAVASCVIDKQSQAHIELNCRE